MNDERCPEFSSVPHSSFIVHHFPYAAIETLPPCKLVDTGEQAGPLCLRPLNQNAVSQTCAPAASVLANATSIFVTFPAFPSNFQALISVGGVAPV